jgi:Reverse transcriptase (RNA-dependent DNA polymerase)
VEPQESIPTLAQQQLVPAEGVVVTQTEENYHHIPSETTIHEDSGTQPDVSNTGPNTVKYTNEIANIPTTRSGRQVKRPAYLDDYVTSNITSVEHQRVDTTIAFTDMADPIALMLTGNQGNFYCHEILHEPDKDKFIKAMKDEIKSHNENHNWEPVLRSKLPEGTKVIPSVWTMRRKRRLVDGIIHKWKARLIVDGSKQIKGINFWETYAPVAQWISIWLILCMASLNDWKIKTFDFVQAFPQAPSKA